MREKILWSDETKYVTFWFKYHIPHHVIIMNLAKARSIGYSSETWCLWYAMRMATEKYMLQNACNSNSKF